MSGRRIRVYLPLMNTAHEIETAFRTLSKAQQDELLERLNAIWEEGLEVKEEFKQSIRDAQNQIAQGQTRVHKIPA